MNDLALILPFVLVVLAVGGVAVSAVLLRRRLQRKHLLQEAARKDRLQAELNYKQAKVQETQLAAQKEWERRCQAWAAWLTHNHLRWQMELGAGLTVKRQVQTIHYTDAEPGRPPIVAWRRERPWYLHVGVRDVRWWELNSTFLGSDPSSWENPQAWNGPVAAFLTLIVGSPKVVYYDLDFETRYLVQPPVDCQWLPIYDQRAKCVMSALRRDTVTAIALSVEDLGTEKIIPQRSPLSLQEWEDTEAWGDACQVVDRVFHDGLTALQRVFDRAQKVSTLRAKRFVS